MTTLDLCPNSVLGYHRTYLGGLERGERNLTLKALERVADRLDVDPLSLMADSH